ncbi:MAG: plasmid stabilization protein [Mesorhizobium sp.]|nr:plasmid stabilization protein [Mesorhizobium sp.]
MAQLLVRNIEEDVKTRLRKRAARHGTSMEEEARSILRDAVKDEGEPTMGLGDEIAALFKDNREVLEEMPRDYLRPPDFAR